MSNQTPHWRPRSYPTQTCTDHSSHDDSTLSSPVPEEPLPPLPTTIRAVQDSATPSEGRTLIICLDGTGDQFDNDNSNVVNFVACLKKDDHSQVTYYQSGIGTYDGHGLKGGFSASLDMAVGSGLGIHIKDAYRFLMQNYREGDRICLLGFSRGSYTIRCLAGMLHKVGLLPAGNRAQVSFAYKFYKNDTKEGWDMSAEFKKTFCTSVQVYFVGVWDCVASVGFFPRKLPFSKSPTNSIHYFRHAMALDEHRAKFKICQWQHQDPAAKTRTPTIDNTPKGKAKEGKEKAEGSRIGRAFGSCFGSKESTTEMNGSAEKRSSISSISPLKKRLTGFTEKDDQDKHELEFEKREHSIHKHVETNVLEVWFAGAHADVGGGAVQNQERHVLSRIPLRWMIRQCFEANTGILFDTAALAETGLDVPTLWPTYKPLKKPFCGPSPDMVAAYEEKIIPPLRRRSTALGVDRNEKKDGKEKGEERDKERVYGKDDRGDIYSFQHDLELLPEQVEDHFDAMAPINDQLVQAKGWWVLEFWPVKIRVQKEDTGEWEKKVGVNMGRYRAIREVEPRMHWTVQMRMGEGGYRVRNRVDVEAVWGVAT